VNSAIAHFLTYTPRFHSQAQAASWVLTFFTRLLVCDVDHIMMQPSTSTRPHDQAQMMTALSMSMSNQTARPSPSSNFALIFDTAVGEYKRLTGLNLRTHPLAAAIDVCNSPDIILTIFRKQAQAFDRFCKSDDRLLMWLDPTVQVLFALSTTLGEGIDLVRLSFLPCSIHRRLCLQLAIFSRKRNLHRYWYSPRGKSLPSSHIFGVRVHDSQFRR
jgi:hypothetical protein